MRRVARWLPLQPVRITLGLSRSGVNESLHQPLKCTVRML